MLGLLRKSLVWYAVIIEHLIMYCKCLAEIEMVVMIPFGALHSPLIDWLFGGH